MQTNRQTPKLFDSANQWLHYRSSLFLFLCPALHKVDIQRLISSLKSVLINKIDKERVICSCNPRLCFSLQSGWFCCLVRLIGVHPPLQLGLPLWLSWWRIHLQYRRPGFHPWFGKIPCRRERLPTPVFWPGEFYGLYSPWVAKSQTWLCDFHTFTCSWGWG